MGLGCRLASDHVRSDCQRQELPCTMYIQPPPPLEQITYPWPAPCLHHAHPAILSCILACSLAPASHVMALCWHCEGTVFSAVAVPQQSHDTARRVTRHDPFDTTPLKTLKLKTVWGMLEHNFI